MNNERYERSRFMKWCLEHPGPYTLGEEIELRKEAMAALVESVNAGDITSLDGAESPLSERIRAQHGVTDFEMNSNWVGSSQDWICPCCGRSKFQVSRVGKKGQILAKLVVHHDHMGEAMKAAFHSAFEAAGTSVEQIDGWRLVERMGEAFAAYAEVLVCEDCNNADTEAKKLVGSPSYFSFSIGQIRRLIRSADHRAHLVEPARAAEVWAEVEPAYKLRMKLIRAVAQAAATDAHWYEPHARGADPIPVFGFARRSIGSEIGRWASPDPLLRTLGSNTKVSVPNLSRWRQVAQKPGKQPPANYLAMLRTEESHGRSWDALPEDWRCPICHRSKHELVYVGEQGKVIFAMRLITARGAWASVTHICNHCESTLMSLKWEGAQGAGKAVRDSYSIVEPAELSRIIAARPHSAHEIRGKEAQELLAEVVQRISQAR
jgi:rubredoxin